MRELGELGFNCAVLGLDTLMHAAKAIEAVLLDMKSGKFARRNDGMDFEEYKQGRRIRPMGELGRSVYAAAVTALLFVVPALVARTHIGEFLFTRKRDEQTRP